VAKSNILVNSPNETKYYYQDLDMAGARLNGANRYTVTFPKDRTPPVNGFWSLTLYNEHHFFAKNDLKRYSLGTKNRDLNTTQTDRSPSMCRPIRQPTYCVPTGYPRPRMQISRCSFEPIGRRLRFSTAYGRHRESSVRKALLAASKTAKSYWTAR
jgi:Protein of unknown function (DUF1214)